jgi:hypothetical protein
MLQELHDMKTYYVEWSKGCTLYDARDEDHAQRQARSDWGMMNGPFKARLADDSDICWQKAMGGRLTDLAEARYEKLRK